MDTEILEKVGLTRGEIKVYVTLLELGLTRTGLLTTEAKVSRSKVYEILEKLMQKGLVSYVIRENTKYFEASDPKNLEEYLEKRKKELEATAQDLQNLIPTLERLQGQEEEKQIATVFSGYAGIRTVFNSILNELKKGDEYYAFAVGEPSYTKEFSTFIMNYHRKREEKGIRVKLLANTNVKKRILTELGDYKHISFRFTEEKSPAATLIFGSKVFIFTWNNPTAFLIESHEIAQQYKMHFLDTWRRA